MGKSKNSTSIQTPLIRAIAALSALVLMSACEDIRDFNFGAASGAQEDGDGAATAEAPDQKFIEQDVEAPDVFSANENALWDGRPSLGGVWVAHPDVGDPERVMIRNQENGKFVVGALFRRERDIPGPKLQLSSDAAQALDVLAGSPVELTVVALRKERIPVSPPEPDVPAEVAAAPDAPAEIEETALDPIAAAGAAIEASDPTPAASAAPETTPTIESTLPVSRLNAPYIQVGIYNVERNAQAVANQMRSAGMVPALRETSTNGSPSWRVVVGPATSADERDELLAKIKAEGYSDAFPVNN